MNINDPEVHGLIRHSMVARIATLSHNGRPSITPLYFVIVDGHIWLGTADWTLAAREVAANPCVSVLFEIERNRNGHRILRVTGSACIRTDSKTMKTSNLRMLRKYILTPGAILNRLTHLQLLGALRDYRAQGKAKGQGCVIDVTPERIEILSPMLNEV